jgi:hypothetical protein
MCYLSGRTPGQPTFHRHLSQAKQTKNRRTNKPSSTTESDDSACGDTFPGDSLPVHSEDLHYGNADHECHDSSNSLNSNMSGSDEDEDNDSGSFLPLHAVLEAEDMALEDGEVLDELFSPSGVSPVSFTLYFQHSLIFIS